MRRRVRLTPSPHNTRPLPSPSFRPPPTRNSRVTAGGSVTPETVDELMACPDIDGALVGGASLVADKFARIVGFKSAVSA